MLRPVPLLSLLNVLLLLLVRGAVLKLPICRRCRWRNEWVGLLTVVPSFACIAGCSVGMTAFVRSFYYFHMPSQRVPALLAMLVFGIPGGLFFRPQLKMFGLRVAAITASEVVLDGIHPEAAKVLLDEGG